MGPEDFEWRHMGNGYATSRGIRQWRQLKTTHSHTAYFRGTRLRIIYYAFMSHDRLLLILLEDIQ